jgi:hypothetical protein
VQWDLGDFRESYDDEREDIMKFSRIDHPKTHPWTPDMAATDYVEERPMNARLYEPWRWPLMPSLELRFRKMMQTLNGRN